MNEEPTEIIPTFSIVAYLAAVAVGCLVVGGLIPWGDGVMAPAALLVGFLPGLLICLPGTLLSFQVSKRFRLFGAVWYGVFGVLTGISVGILFVMASTPDVTSVLSTGLVFATAGTAAAFTYRWVDEREFVYRTKNFEANQRKLGN